MKNCSVLCNQRDPYGVTDHLLCHPVGVSLPLYGNGRDAYGMTDTRLCHPVGISPI